MRVAHPYTKQQYGINESQIGLTKLSYLFGFSWEDDLTSKTDNQGPILV